MARNTTIKAAVVGASGYIGRELVRILLRHPGAQLTAATSRKHAGKKYSDLYGEFLGVTDLEFTDPDLKTLAAGNDVVFVATPHGESPTLIPYIEAGNPNCKIIDLSDSFRTDAQWVYGLTEFAAHQLSGAKRVANPGCFATSIVLALYPLVAEDLCKKFVSVDSKTGSSGSGVNPSEGTHHPLRAANFKAYSLFTHRHMKEITHCLQGLHKPMPDISFAPQSAPMVRGIYTVVHAQLNDRVSEAGVRAAIEKYYKGRNFIRLRTDIPEVNNVVGTNFCDIATFVHEGKLIVISALDNLIKGGSGQAVQNMNLMFGLEESKGLM